MVPSAEYGMLDNSGPEPAEGTTYLLHVTPRSSELCWRS